MLKWFNNLKSISFVEDSEVDKMDRLLSKFKNSNFGKNYLVQLAEDGGDFSYSNLIFFEIEDKSITNDDIYNNSPVPIRDIDYYASIGGRRVSVRKKDYYTSEGIIRIIEYESLLYTLINKYNELSDKDKKNIAVDYRETLEKLYNFTMNTRVYIISEDDYDLVKVTLSLILDNIENDISIDKNAIREELKMEVKYLNTLREKQIRMKEFEEERLKMEENKYEN